MNAFWMRSTALIIVSIALCPQPAGSQTIALKLATDDTPGTPWIIGSGRTFHPDAPGIEIELYQRMAARLGIKLRMVRMPWKRCLTELGQGQVDGVFPASFKPERLKLGVYPMHDGTVDPARKSRDSAYHLYTLDATPLDWDGQAFINLNQMKRQTIGVPLGWSIVSDLRQMGIDLLEKPKPLDLLFILKKGGLAGVICLDTVMDTYINQSPIRFSGINKIDPPVAKKAYYLMLSHAFASRHPALAENIWNTIAAIKSEDQFKQIVERYMQ